MALQDECSAHLVWCTSLMEVSNSCTTHNVMDRLTTHPIGVVSIAAPIAVASTVRRRLDVHVLSLGSAFSASSSVCY